MEGRAICPKCHFKVPRWHFGKGRTGFPSGESEGNAENAGGANREVGANGKASDQDSSGKGAAYPQKRKTQWRVGSQAFVGIRQSDVRELRLIRKNNSILDVSHFDCPPVRPLSD